MTEENNHINYSAADIEKYHRKELSASAMYAMEKAALDDSFLADAMEGYEERSIQSSAPAIDNDINDLKKRLTERIAEKEKTPVIKFSWWKVAAIILVVAGGAWLYTSQSHKGNEQAVVKTESKKETPLPVQTDSATSSNNKPDSLTITNGLVAIEKKPTVQYKVPSASYKRRETKIDSTDVAALSQSPAEVYNGDQLEKSASQKNAKLKKILPAMSVNADSTASKTDSTKTESRMSFIAADKKQKVAADGFTASPALSGRANYSNTFTGTVVDAANKPLANATIQIPNLNIATVTNDKGYFSFKAKDSALKVSIASVGFETQNLELTTNNIDNENINNIIRLKPSLLNLNEVVVTGYGIQKKTDLTKSKDIVINILDAEPSVSMIEYNQYLDKNKKAPDEVKNIHGTVTVLFTVEKDGSLKNFRVKKSLNKKLDTEAIRLVKDGPSWKLLNGIKAKASVEVKF